MKALLAVALYFFFIAALGYATAVMPARWIRESPEPRPGDEA